MRLGPLDAAHRASVADMLEATNVFSADEVRMALELFDEADYEFLGAFGDDDALLGYACFGPTPSTDGTYDLYWLAVHPHAQGQGIGRALVRTVEEILVARSARMLIVETSSRTDYEQTRTFYTRAGYAEAARIRDFYRPADDRIIYTTRLTSRERGAATR